MKIQKLIATLAFAAFALSALAQTATPVPNVSVNSKGDDVRSILHSLFTQAKKNYVLEPSIRFSLYLSLQDVEFEEALQLICKTANLRYEQQNGIIFVTRAPAAKAAPATTSTAATTAVAPVQPKGKLPETVLNRPVTTHFDKIDIRLLFQDLSKQTGVTIELDKGVPAYRLDAYLVKTSLKFALTTICQAAHLDYSLTNNQTILLKQKSEESRVALANGN